MYPAAGAVDGRVGGAVRGDGAAAVRLRGGGLQRHEINWRMALTHREIFERHVYASAISRDPNVYAAMFTEGRRF